MSDNPEIIEIHPIAGEKIEIMAAPHPKAKRTIDFLSFDNCFW
jgi:hypothetical protein